MALPMLPFNTYPELIPYTTIRVILMSMMHLQHKKLETL